MVTEEVGKTVKGAPAKAASKKGGSKKKGLGNGKALADTNISGAPYLPDDTFKPTVVKELDIAVRKIENELKPAFAAARDALVKAQEDLLEKCHKHKAAFVEDPVTKSQVYDVNGAKIELPVIQDKIKTSLKKPKDAQDV
jgi:hypothetical protein